MSQKVAEDVEQEVRKRLAEGEAGTSIADDMDEVSESTVYRIKDRLEAELGSLEEKEDEVFDEEPDVNREAFEAVFRDLGVGVKVDGELKAKVDQALSAIELEGAMDNPHLARDILAEEANMTWKWANRVVGKVFSRPGFPHDEEGDREEDRRGGYGYRRGREEPRRDRREPRRDRGHDRDRRDPPPRRDPRPRWVDNLEDQMEEQLEALKAVAEAVGQDQQGGGPAGPNGMIEVQRPNEQGEFEVIRVPADSARARELVGAEDEQDFIEQLATAKEAGLIPDPRDYMDDDDGQHEALEAGLESIAEAQEQMSANFQAAISELGQMAAADDTDDLSAEDVEAIFEEKMTQAERDQLRNEIQDLKRQVENQGSGLFRAGADGIPLMEDREVMTRYVDKQAESDQLQTVQHAGDRLMEEGLPEVRRTLRELAGMMRYGQPPAGENAPRREGEIQSWTPGQEEAEAGEQPPPTGQPQGPPPATAAPQAEVEAEEQPAETEATAEESGTDEAADVWETLTQAEGGA